MIHFLKTNETPYPPKIAINLSTIFMGMRERTEAAKSGTLLRKRLSLNVSSGGNASGYLKSGKSKINYTACDTDCNTI